MYSFNIYADNFQEWRLISGHGSITDFLFVINYRREKDGEMEVMTGTTFEHILIRCTIHL